jgi:putative transposase
MRELMNAIFFVLRGGCPWRMLPEHFPPHQTTYRWFTRFRDDGTWETLNHHLVMLDRQRVGREASPSAAIIDSQSVKTTEAGGPRGYDAGKKINGRKRHAMVDTDGRGVMLQVHPASVQDRDGAIPLLRASRGLLPFIERVFADSAYAAERVANATSIIIEIVRKQVGQIGFAVHPRRWVVERFFAWLGRNRRLAKSLPPRRRGTSRPPSPRPLPSSMPHPCCCSPGGWLVRFEIRVRWGDWGLSPVIRWLPLS